MTLDDAAERFARAHRDFGKKAAEARRCLTEEDDDAKYVELSRQRNLAAVELEAARKNLEDAALAEFKEG